MRNIRTLIGAAGTLVIIVAMVRWGGTARPGPLFVTGVALFIGAIFTFGLALWWLYFSPLPQKALMNAARPRWIRQLFGILAFVSGFFFVIGGFWDEVWHRRFGWENIQHIGGGFNRDAAFDQAFWARPEWLYPVVLITIGAFVGNCAVYALRRWWAAPVVAVFILAFRLIALTAFDAWSVNMRFISHLLLLAPMIALGLWYARKQAPGDNLRTILVGNAIAWIALVLIDLPIISQTLIYPRINSSTLPGMVAFGLVMALAAGWAGARLGAWLAVMDKASTESLAENTYHEGVVNYAQNV